MFTSSEKFCKKQLKVVKWGALMKKFHFLHAVVAYLTISSLVLLGATSSVLAAELTKLRMGQSPEKTRLVLEIKNNYRYEISQNIAKKQIQVDFYKTVNGLSFDYKTFLDQRVLSAKVEKHPKKTSVIFQLAKPFEYHFFTLAARKKGGAERVVIDLLNQIELLPSQPEPVLSKEPQVAQAADLVPVAKQLPVTKQSVPSAKLVTPTEVRPVKSKTKLTQSTLLPKPAVPEPQPLIEKEEFIIAIDAGHGGKDSGAIGRNKTLEKDITLAISLKLKQKIDALPNMRAVLTRDTDVFIPLKQRVRIAHQKRADIFLSIHADSFPQAPVQGASAYVLSTSGASSVMARILANSENASLQEVKLKGRESDVAFVLSDMTREANIRASRKLGQLVLGEIARHGKIHKPYVESAEFAVLRSIDMPSLLIETAFLSTPSEEKRLKNPVFQNKMAIAIAQGVQKFVHRNSDQPHWGETLYVYYKVQSGDTLSEIAQNYDISVEKLRRMNRIRKADKLYIGKTLKIPVSANLVAKL